MTPFWDMYETIEDQVELIRFLNNKCPYMDARRSIWNVAVEMLLKIDTVFSEELAAARFTTTKDAARLTIRKAVVNTRMRTPEKFDSLVKLEPGVSDVLLALVAADHDKAILVEFMGIFKAIEILAYLYLLDGLYPISFDDSIGGEDGILDELHTALCVERSHDLLVLMNGSRLRLPTYKSVLNTIEASRSYLLSKQMGEKLAAEHLGLERSRVSLHRKRVNQKLKGLNWSFK